MGGLLTSVSSLATLKPLDRVVIFVLGACTDASTCLGTSMSGRGSLRGTITLSPPPNMLAKNPFDLGWATAGTACCNVALVENALPMVRAFDAFFMAIMMRFYGDSTCLDKKIDLLSKYMCLCSFSSIVNSISNDAITDPPPLFRPLSLILSASSTILRRSKTWQGH